MTLSTKHIIALQMLPGIGKQTIIKKIIPSITYDNITDSELQEFILNFPGRKKIEPQNIAHALSEADRILEQSEQLNIKAISYSDPEFPPALKKALNDKGKEDPAVIIYCKGDLSVLQKDAVAVIGSRRCSEPAYRSGRLLARKFAERDFCIVSGLAVGCDTSAHIGALEAADGKTIAVLGNGLNTVYPAENRELAEKIVDQGGLLLSEYPIGTGATPYNMVARDRLQTALSSAVLVIQTSRNGGTMHAAKAAYHSHKLLYVLRFKNMELNNAEETAGNHILAREYNAMYIGGYKNSQELNADLDDISRHIRAARSSGGLFDGIF